MLLAVCCGLAATQADDETEAFIRELIKDARTDSERSALLMEAVSLAEGNDKLKITLLEKSVVYGLRSLRTSADCEKFQTVLQSLAQADPDRKAHWLSQQAAVHRRNYILTKSLPGKRVLAQAAVATLMQAGSISAAKGDWKKAAGFFNDGKVASAAYRLPKSAALTGYIRAATYLYKAQAKIDGHIATLKKTPDDLDVRSDLIEMLVTVMDDPGEAMKYVNEDVDERFRIFVPMAAGDISEQPAEACRNLGDWYYKELSKSVIPIVKFRMLARARAYYGRMLGLHVGSDVTSAAVKLNLAKIKSDHAKLKYADPLVCPCCSDTGIMPCPACLTGGQATGLRKCIYCKGSGRGKCRTCAGLWELKCARCGGRGKVVTGTDRRGGAYYKVYGRCPMCAGRGVTHRSRSTYSARPGACPACSKQKPESLRGTSPCLYCAGKGGTGTCYTCKGSKTAVCTHCAAGKAKLRSRTVRSPGAGTSTRPARPPRRRPRKPTGTDPTPPRP